MPKISVWYLFSFILVLLLFLCYFFFNIVIIIIRLLLAPKGNKIAIPGRILNNWRMEVVSKHRRNVFCIIVQYNTEIESYFVVVHF